MLNEENYLPEDVVIKKKPLKKILIILSLFIGFIFLSSILTLGIFANKQLASFTQAAQINPTKLLNDLQTGWKKEPINNNGYINFLVLGLDSLQTRGDSTPLTDSIMLVSLNLNQGKVKVLPLPRDLWSEAYQTKINALYTYGIDRYPQNPAQFPQEVIAELTEVEIHHSLVVSMETLTELIDFVGGIEVDVQHEFVDEEFPRTDVDVTTTTDPSLLYERVEFKKGLQVMNGATALKYMRSRHGTNDENTDNARSQRQQDILQAMLNKFTKKETILNPKLLGQLYRYYLDNFEESLSSTELIAIGKKLIAVRDSISIESKDISIYPDDQTGTIEHPQQYLYDGQWVYIIKDIEEFKQDIDDQLFN